MMEVSQDLYDSARWADKISLAREERYTAIQGLDVARMFMLLIANTTDTHHDDGRPRFNVKLLNDVDRLLDRLKRAERE